MGECTNKKVQVRCFISTLIKNIMLTPSKTVTRLLLRSNHGLFFDQQLNDPIHLFLRTTQQQQMRQMSQQGVHVQAKKSLFDFHPTGVMDRDVAKVDAALKKAIAAAKAKGFDPEVELPPQQYAAHMRRWIDGYFKKLARHPTYVEAVDGCKHEELTVPVEEGEGGQVRVLVHTP